MKTLKELLIEFDACSPAIEWAGDKTIEEVVKECHRGDWLLWLSNELQLPERKLIACAGHCVNTVGHFLKEKKSIKLLDMCMNFEDESISFEELKKARQAARAANAKAARADAAFYAAAAAEAGVCAADDAARYASYAAEDAFYSNRAAAREQNELQTANIVRERLGQDIINKVNKLLNN